MRRRLSIGTHRQVLFGQSNHGGCDDQKIWGGKRVPYKVYVEKTEVKRQYRRPG